MPILTVCGMPNIPPGGAATEKVLTDLILNLQDVVASVLNIEPNEVTVFFPSDLVKSGLGEELICFVDNLFEKPERTTDLRRALSMKVCIRLNLFALQWIPQCQKVEVIVRRFNQDLDGFAVLDVQKSAS